MAVATMAFAGLALAGCSGLGLTPPSPQEAALACPRVAIVRDLQEVTQFRPGAGRDVSDAVSRAALLDYAGNCEYTSDGVTVNLKLTLLAERGPALQGTEASYRYFVAVARPGEEVPVAKTEFDVAIGFPAGQTRVMREEELTPKIPLPKDSNAKEWRILVGFQLTPDQLEYNLAQKRS